MARSIQVSQLEDKDSTATFKKQDGYVAKVKDADVTSYTCVLKHANVSITGKITVSSETDIIRCRKKHKFTDVTKWAYVANDADVANNTDAKSSVQSYLRHFSPCLISYLITFNQNNVQKNSVWQTNRNKIK